MTRWKTFVVVLSVTVLAVSGSVGDAQAATRHHAVPVLGSKKFAGTYGKGWGHAHPKEIYNGGDPSGDVSMIKWTHWGSSKSYGWGKTSLFKPGGGYYSKSGKAELRAQNLGKCGSTAAYTHLWVREPSKPGGKLGKWFSWSYKNHTLCTDGFS